MQYQIKISSFDSILLNTTLNNILELFEKIGLEKSEIKINRLPCKIKKITILRSPHVDKKSRDQLERRTSQILITLPLFLIDHDQIFSNYICNNIIPGIGITIQITKIIHIPYK